MKISIYGIGYVGAVFAACLAKAGHRVIAVDANPAKADAINAGRSPIFEPGLDEMIAEATAAGLLTATTDPYQPVFDTEVSFVCVGTPSLPNGKIDFSYVIGVSQQLGEAMAKKPGRHAVVVRSTMVPGSTEEVVTPILERAAGAKAGDGFGLAYYPEFLRETSAIKDYYDPGTVVIGEVDAATADIVERLNDGNGGTVFRVPTRTAEAIKYANNSWHALKISFANEIGLIAKAAGVDGRAVMEILCADKRLNISPVYLRPGFAFGGSCLPKDLRGLRFFARGHDVATPVLDAAVAANDNQITRAMRMIEATGKRRVALLGLTFKPRTDDLRESPFVELAERLVGKGYAIKIFDQDVTYSRLAGANRQFILSHLPHLLAVLEDDLEAALRHAEIVVLGKPVRDRPGWTSLIRPRHTVIDLAGIGEGVPSLPDYHGICW